ncbi:hypothetical protein D9619_009318 [Psilocybe cf. subviscida]|uniref:Uncharacterized protein n=1 Tax=Psilocybe cf. subviscida TaxID=2480587 RepID=A0A8H5BUF3_9AGAR|nr:hypothetical protein D9619_009318 [Psilocybe cf. subviscida]
MAVLARRSFLDFAELAARRPDEDNEKHGVSTKMVLEYALVTLAILLGVYIVFRRIRGLKPANQTYWQFFVQVGGRKRGVHYIPRNPTFNRTPGTLNPDGGLAILPAAYQGYSTRRTQAQDVDANGRRIGGAEVDHDGALDDKDILPAYDIHGGPPKYFEPLPGGDTPSSVEPLSRPAANGASNREAEDYVNRPPSFASSHVGDVSAIGASPSPSRLPSSDPAPPPDAMRPTTDTQTTELSS